MMELLIGLIITLALGAYGWTTMVYVWLRTEIKSIWVRLNNHYEHRVQEIEQRLGALERKKDS